MGDGAEWEHGFISLHRPAAVHLLDRARAVAYLDAAAQAACGNVVRTQLGRWAWAVLLRRAVARATKG